MRVRGVHCPLRRRNESFRLPLRKSSHVQSTGKENVYRIIVFTRRIPATHESSAADARRFRRSVLSKTRLPVSDNPVLGTWPKREMPLSKRWIHFVPDGTRRFN